MHTKKMTLTIFYLGVMLLLAMPTSLGRDVYARTEVAISKTDDGVFVGEFKFRRQGGHDEIVVDVYKVFPDNAKSYHYALYQGRKYMIEYAGGCGQGCYTYTIHVHGETYVMYKGLQWE